jgi:hypothetical protein
VVTSWPCGLQATDPIPPGITGRVFYAIIVALQEHHELPTYMTCKPSAEQKYMPSVELLDECSMQQTY